MKYIALDTETHLLQPGIAAPPLVCGSAATEALGSERLLTPAETVAAFRGCVEDKETGLVGANIAYDFGVLSAHDSALVDGVFQLLDEGRAFDVQILEKLHLIATGGLERAEVSLAALETLHLGINRAEQKENGWRYSYALLEGVPFEQWPVDAVQYPRDDARGTLDVFMRQMREPETVQVPHRPSVDGRCIECGQAEPFAHPTCRSYETGKRWNREQIAPEMRAAWFLRLACMWGVRTDPELVPEVVGDIKREHEESRRRFFEVGIVRVRPCNKKDGEYERADDIPAEWLDWAYSRLVGSTEWVNDPNFRGWQVERLADIETCRKALEKGRPIRFAEDKGRLKGLVTAAYKGEPPLTDGGASGNRQVSTSRDTLCESGDDLLEEYGDAGPNEKLLSTYCDVLEQGTRVPINAGANSLVATQRTSYFKPNLQQLPRHGMVRMCFVPRGYVYEEEEGNGDA